MLECLIKKKCDDDNQTIGIIFCTDKDESIVRYSVLSGSKQISKPNIGKFDYTEWQKEYFDKSSPEELNEKVADFAKTYTFKGNPDSVLK